MDKCIICHDTCTSHDAKRIDCNYNANNMIHNQCIMLMQKKTISKYEDILVCPLCSKSILIKYYKNNCKTTYTTYLFVMFLFVLFINNIYLLLLLLALSSIAYKFITKKRPKQIKFFSHFACNAPADKRLY